VAKADTVPKPKEQKTEDKKGFPQELDTTRWIRSEAVRELFEIRDGELPMKTNTPARALMPFVLMETVEYGMSMVKDTPLSAKFREFHDKRMIGKGGKGRGELLAALQSLMRDEGDEGLGI